MQNMASELAAGWNSQGSPVCLTSLSRVRLRPGSQRRGCAHGGEGGSPGCRVSVAGEGAGGGRRGVTMVCVSSLGAERKERF